jgi:ribonucleoside-diphosphate reductase alpha chain
MGFDKCINRISQHAGISILIIRHNVYNLQNVTLCQGIGMPVHSLTHGVPIFSGEDKMKLSDNALAVLERRYLSRDDSGKLIEKPQDMFRRVARNIASAESSYGKNKKQIKEIEDEFYELMMSLDFLPNSPTLMNAGKDIQQLSACFVLPVGDSMESIFDALKNAAMIHKSGGGTGFSFTRLRPKNDAVHSTKGVSSGPVSFMKVFNAATEAIKQGGTRRGANMGILRVDHPDIKDFIICKEDLTVLTNFNISVAATDKFMNAVKKGQEYELVNPRTGKAQEKVSAKDMFDQIVSMAWKTGDPGMIFIDKINAGNPTPGVGEIESTNPCVAGDTWVHTEHGPSRVMDLLGKPFGARIDGQDFQTGPDGFFKTATKKVFRLTTKEGYELRLTEDHPVRCVNSITRNALETGWRKAGELRPGEKIVLNDHRLNGTWPGKGSWEEGYLLGLLIGDGTLKKDKAVISVWEEDGHEGIMAEALRAAKTLPHRCDFAGWVSVSGRNEHRLTLGHIKALAQDLGMAPGNKVITDKLEKCSSDFQRGFLRGFFDTDGSVQGSQSKGVSVRLAQSDLPKLQAVQRILLRLGIVSKIYKQRRTAGISILPDGKGGSKEYQTLAQHELIISGENMARFKKIVGFSHTKKALRLDDTLKSYKRKMNRERFVASVESIIMEATEDVYDVQVPGTHVFDANGVKVHNCGEQPLLPFESCNLGSINLSNMVVNGKVDWKRLESAVNLAVRFLDDVIDKNKYPLPEIAEMTLSNRKIGLGVMGWADMLIQLGIAYESQEAYDFAVKTMKFIQEKGHKASEELAKERGAFPNFKKSIYKKGKPIRNATITTIAPTGTISMIADCSSGIEPIYSIAYVKRVMDNDELRYVNPNFEDVCKDRGLYTDELEKAVVDSGSVSGIPGFPADLKALFSTAHEITPEGHVRMQAAFQKHTDNAVSKTVNLSASATKDDIARIYQMAYELDCKGVTVYRDGSRGAQVLESGTKKEKAEPLALQTKLFDGQFDENGKLKPRARPLVTQGATHRMSTGCGYLYVTINEDQKNLFELFARMGKAGGCAASQTEAIGRLISLALRCGIDPVSIVEQLKGIRCPERVLAKEKIYSCPDAIGKALQAQLETHGQKFTEMSKLDRGLRPECPECGAPIEFSEGCLVCRACGFSKC